MFRAARPLAYIAILLVALSGAATALPLDQLETLPGEKVLSFDSKIEVNADSTLTVSETIKVNADGNVIKRGITRDIVLRWYDAANDYHSMKYELLEVLRDGSSSEYHTSDTLDGVRIYFGEEDVFLTPGTYTYFLRYRVSDALAVKNTQANLLWNVTGNQWVFPIGRVSATVIVPHDYAEYDAWTGPYGSTAQDYTRESAVPGMRFETTQVLMPGEGLTVAASFAASELTPPGWTTVHAVEVAGMVGLCIVLIYLLAAWLMVGKDPPAGSIMPADEPPAGMSPAALRFVSRMGHDFKGFTSTLVSLASKGCLTMEVDAGEEYTLHRVECDTAALTEEERAVWAALFRERTSVVVSRDNQSLLSSAQSALTRAVSKQYGRKYFVFNRGWNFFGWVITALTAFLMLGATANVLSRPNVVAVGIVIMLLLALNILFVKLMPAYKPAGRRLLDEIEGFRQNLAYSTPKAEPTDVQAERASFDRHLAYAMALDMHSQWVRKFEERAAASAPQGQQQQAHYAPYWYNDPYMRGGFNFRSFMYNINDSFNSSLSTASTPASSSSSGGGGGFSGGGGGGGGGGGW